MTRFVLITGGVVSSVGKGVITASLGYLLKNSEISTTCVKIDPYLNVDAGTMSPYEHGEVFVLDDGSEVDLDLGNYERLIDIKLSGDHSLTSGKVFDRIIKSERQGKFIGKTVQFVPHVTNFIKDQLIKISKKTLEGEDNPPEICLVELGGTPGDIESMMFIEALRQLSFQIGKHNFVHVHVTYVPMLTTSGEQKSRPAQQGILELRKAGLTPDVIICRCRTKVKDKIIKKISMVGMLPRDKVISLPDMESTFEVPIEMIKQKFPQSVVDCLGLKGIDFSRPLKIVDEIVTFVKKKKILPKISVGFVGKYIDGSDCYISLISALETCSRKIGVCLDLVEINPEEIESYLNNKATINHQVKKIKISPAQNKFSSLDCILIPGGFGNRGIEGKIKAAQYARENNIPFLGICLGMQIIVIEYARNMLNWPNANSSEFVTDSDDDQVVIFMPEGNVEEMGGTMRVGARKTILSPQTQIKRLYNGAEIVTERYRHRYEINPRYIEKFENKGLIFGGKDESGRRMEAVELKSNRYHIGVQYHPEFLNNPRRPAPVILGFIRAAYEYKLNTKNQSNKPKN